MACSKSVLVRHFERKEKAIVASEMYPDLVESLHGEVDAAAG